MADKKSARVQAAGSDWKAALKKWADENASKPQSAPGLPGKKTAGREKQGFEAALQAHEASARKKPASAQFAAPAWKAALQKSFSRAYGSGAHPSATAEIKPLKPKHSSGRLEKPTAEGEMSGFAAALQAFEAGARKKSSPAQFAMPAWKAELSKAAVGGSHPLDRPEEKPLKPQEAFSLPEEKKTASEGQKPAADTALEEGVAAVRKESAPDEFALPGGDADLKKTDADRSPPSARAGEKAAEPQPASVQPKEKETASEDQKPAADTALEESGAASRKESAPHELALPGGEADLKKTEAGRSHSSARAKKKTAEARHASVQPKKKKTASKNKKSAAAAAPQGESVAEVAQSLALKPGTAAGQGGGAVRVTYSVKHVDGTSTPMREEDIKARGAEEIWNGKVEPGEARGKSVPRKPDEPLVALREKRKSNPGPSKVTASRKKPKASPPKMAGVRRSSVPRQQVVSLRAFAPESEPGRFPAVLSVSPDAALHLPLQADSTVSRLLSDGMRGTEAHFDPDGDSEFVLGIDFGTSAVKVAVKDGGRGRVHAVPFVDAPGVDMYLLPTRLYEASPGCYTLQPGAARVSGAVKLDLMNDMGSRRARVRAAAFLALVIRQARDWIYENLWEEDDGEIAWECRIGRPSNNSDEYCRKVWKTLLMAAWQAAGIPGDVTSESVCRVMDRADYSELEDYFDSIPEVQAEADGFLREHPSQDQQNFTLVDIGSGTVDISAFCLSRSPTNGNTYVWNFGMSIQPLGTTNCHRARLQWLSEALEAYEADAAVLKSPQSLSVSRKLHAEADEATLPSLRERLKDDWDEYASGIQFSSSDWNIDDEFQRRVYRDVREIRAGCVRNGHIPRDKLPEVSVILCGGGSRSRLYSDALQKFAPPNARWLRMPKPEHLTPISRLQLVQKIADDDYDRLLVAYGLSSCSMGEAPEDATGGSKPVFDFTDRYIDKDMM